jgi:hypothetical protein
VLTASDELAIFRSLVYRLVAKFRTAAAGFAIEAVSWSWRFLLTIILARQLKFQRIRAVYDLSTERHHCSEISLRPGSQGYPGDPSQLLAGSRRLPGPTFLDTRLRDNERDGRIGVGGQVALPLRPIKTLPKN